MIKIYTDGACLGNPGPGGWAAIILREGAVPEPLSGLERRTTNNRMEITAAIKGLEAVPPGSEVAVYTDSQYVANTMTKGWKRQANQDLWAELDRAVSARRVSWRWVRGHNGDPFNEEADRLAQEMAHLAANPVLSQAEGPVLSQAEGPVLSQAEGPVLSQAEGGSVPAATAQLSHIDPVSGRARMVDVTSKNDTERVAVARGSVVMKPETLALIKEGAVAKGDALSVAQIAGTMGAKQTSNLIPMCHPLLLTNIKVELELDEARSAVDIQATVKTTGKTGVEMEALTAVAVAALTIYDMCKAVDRGMKIQDVRLAYKSGGKSGEIVLESTES